MNALLAFEKKVVNATVTSVFTAGDVGRAIGALLLKLA
jgi:hypothetical protein